MKYIFLAVRYERIKVKPMEVKNIKKNNIGVVSVIIGLVLMFSMINIVPFVHASSNKEITLFLDSYSVETCPYTTKMITGYVESKINREIEVKLFSNSKWVTIAQDSLMLSPHEKKEIMVFITPTDEAKVGKYIAKIFASTSNSKISEEITINIMDCSDISLNIKNTTINACIGDNLKIPFYIQNNGKTTEHVILNVNKGKLDFYETILDSYERDKNYWYYKVIKEYDVVDLKANSKNTFANAEKKIYVNGEDCYHFDMTVVPQSADICMSDEGVFNIYLKNVGDKEDIVHLKSSIGVLSSNEVVLKPGEEKVVKLKVRLGKAGESAIEIEAWDSVTHQSRDLQITGKYCSNNALLIVPKRMEVCKGSSARFVVGVRNLGEVNETLKLENNIGEISNKEIKLSSGETAYRELYVDTRELNYGNYSVELNLTKDGKVIDSIQGQVEVKNCYNGEISTQYKEVKACKFVPSKPVDIVVKNTGEKEETYYLSGKYGEFEKSTVSLQPGQEIIIPYRINITKDIAEGIIEDILTLKGEHMVDSKEITLDVDVLKKRMCSNFSVSVEPVRIYAKEYKGYLYKVYIKNEGYAKNRFKVVLDEDYGITDVEPKSITLDSDERGVIYLYVVPHSKMPNKQYNIKGKVIDIYGNEKKFEAILDLNAEKEEFVEGAEEDKIITKAENLDPEKTYYVSKDNVTTVEIEYKMEGKIEREEILFTGGSFIVQIGDELYEDKHPEIGKRTYTLKVHNKTYIITVKFVYINNEKSEYKFKIEDITIEKQKKVLFTSKKESQKAFWRSWRFWIPVVVLLIGVFLIVYDLLSVRKTKREEDKKSLKEKDKRKKEIENLKEAIEK